MNNHYTPSRTEIKIPRKLTGQSLTKFARALYGDESVRCYYTYFKTPKPQNPVLVMFKEQVPWGDKTSITFVKNRIKIFLAPCISRFTLFPW
jgi:hypothetical protein